MCSFTVLYWRATWLFTQRKEQRVTVFEKWVLRKILGLKRDEVTGDWRKLHNESPNYLYFSTTIVPLVKSRRM